MIKFVARGKHEILFDRNDVFKLEPNFWMSPIHLEWPSEKCDLYFEAHKKHDFKIEIRSVVFDLEKNAIKDCDFLEILPKVYFLDYNRNEEERQDKLRKCMEMEAEFEPLYFFDEIKVVRPLVKKNWLSTKDGIIGIFSTQDVFEKAYSMGLEGIKPMPVTNFSGKIFEDHVYWRCNNIMPPAVKDPMQKIWEFMELKDRNRTGYRYYYDSQRIMTYRREDLNLAKDINISRECARLVCSRKFYNFVKSEKLRVQHIRPVLVEGEQMHKEFIKIWSDFLEYINSANPKTVFASYVSDVSLGK